MTKIQDATGSNDWLKVNGFNQAEVYSESVPSEGIQAERGKAFIVHAECHLAAAAAGGLLSITNNDPSHDVEITRIYVDPHTITPTDLIVTQVFDATLASGTDVSSTAIIQKNRGSVIDFDLTVKISDASADLTYTGGIQYHAFPVTSMTSMQRNMQSTNIIPRNKSITFGWKTRGGGNATDGEIISLSVNMVKRTS